MKIRWMKNIMISHVDDNFAIPSCLIILPESPEEAHLLEAFVAWAKRK